MGDVARVSVRHLLGRLDALAIRVKAIVDRRRAADPTLDDPFLGLYLSDDKIDSLLATSRGDEEVPEADTRRAAAERDAEAEEVPSRLMSLRAQAALDEVDEELLLVAAAPDIDERFEAFYGFLNDDVTRRRATVGLALRMAGLSARSATARDRLRAGARLVRCGLVEMDDEGRPLLSRVLRVPDRVVAHLLGSDAPDQTLVDVLAAVHPVETEHAGMISAAVRQGVDVLYLRTTAAGGAAELASAGCRREGRAAVCIDLARLGSPERIAEVAVAAHREALLSGGVLVAGPVDELAEDPGGVYHLRALTDGAALTILHGTTSWDPRWSHSPGVVVEVPALGPDERRQLWSAAAPAKDLGVDPVLETIQFRLTPGQIEQTAAVARQHAALHERPIEGADLRHGARLQNSSKLERLARRIEPGVGWDDLVLPPTTMRALHRLADRARHRETVIDGWHMRPGGGRGRGITALFAGDSGTGKTMSAEVIAAELGLDLYVVNLATVVDKYVGETEKNLDRIFTEASGVNGVLLFDEADALFGQRSEVRDSHDRYANLEIAYLLQRMESFDGLAVLSTNLRANLDEAFARRLDAIVDYPTPPADARRELWAKCLHTVPCADDLDVAFCADAFDLTGGNIRSVAITAAYRAAANDDVVTMATLVASIGEEYRKLGRLCLEAEFGPYHHLAAG